LLVHICCSVDSHFFLQKLREEFPDEKLVGFFYDPNIHPYSEYRLRLLDVRRSCELLGIELLEGEYDFENWLDTVRGYENEPEKGKRCEICFDKRLEVSAKKAKEIGEGVVTTTLLVSPKKSKEQLKKAGEEIERKFGVKFLTVDFRKGGGTQEQFKMAKEAKLYRQNYCGCVYALSKQREEQKRFASELISPISSRTLPASIEEKIDLYEKRMKIEKEGREYRIVREKFLNYRLLRAFVKRDKKIIPSYFLFYSVLKRDFTKGKLEEKIRDFYMFNREEIKFLELSAFNKMIKKSYKSVKELIFNPPSIEEETDLRKKLSFSFFDLSPIIVIDNISSLNGKYEIYCKSELYEDVRENLVIL